MHNTLRPVYPEMMMMMMMIIIIIILQEWGLLTQRQCPGSRVKGT